MLFSLYRKIQYLSLDIVLGAVILLRFFSNVLSVDIPWPIYCLLASSVWSIYSIDHLIDAKKANHSNRARYHFHRRHAKLLIIAVLLTLIGSSILLFYIDIRILISGMLLVAFSGIYLLLQSIFSNKGIKEIYVAFIYTSGILLAPFTFLGEVHWDIAALLFMLTFSNLILFSWFEREEDIADEFNSIATVLKTSTLEKLILLILAVSITSILLMNISVITGYFFIAFVFYSILFLNQRWATNQGRYRVVGDGVFLLPILAECL